MFKAVNTESENERRRAQFEKTRIQKSYLSALKTLNIDKFLAIKIHHEQNQAFYESAKSNLLYNFAAKSSSDAILKKVEEYGILNFKAPLFEFARKSLDEENFIRAHKLLNLAKHKKWTNNDYFELRKRMKSEYFEDCHFERKEKEKCNR